MTPEESGNAAARGAEKIEAARKLRRLLHTLDRLTGHGETFFEIESTDNAGDVLRPLTPEARAWATEFLADMRMDGDDYLVSRAVIGIVFAGASGRGYLVRFA